MSELNTLTARPAKKAEWRFPLRMQDRVGGRLLAADVAADGDFAAEVRVPCPLVADSVRYAACRAFVKSPRLRQALLPVSLRLRVGGRGTPKAVRHCVALPAACFALREGSAYVRFAVTREGVRVERVWLLPAGATPPCRVTLRLLLAPADEADAGGGSAAARSEEPVCG